MKQNQTHRLVMTAMFAALTLLATSVLKIQTPAFGYIHIGEAFVLLSGLMLGPKRGGAAAAIGSGLSDLMGGYAIWTPGTLLIKLLSAAAAGRLFRALTCRSTPGADRQPNDPRARLASAVLLSCIPAEALTIAGYFFYQILITAFSTGSFSRASLASAVSLSAAEIPFNLAQAGAGILLALVLFPVFTKLNRLSQRP